MMNQWIMYESLGAKGIVKAISYRVGPSKFHPHLMKTDWIFKLFDMNRWKTFLRETDWFGSYNLLLIFQSSKKEK